MFVAQSMGVHRTSGLSISERNGLARFSVLILLCCTALPIELHACPRQVLDSFPCQENTYQCCNQSKGGHADKAPLKGVDDHSHNSGFRGAVIPTQVRTVHHHQEPDDSHDAHANGNEQPVKQRETHRLSLSKLQVDDLQLF